jgi:hypothetical protein
LRSSSKLSSWTRTGAPLADCVSAAGESRVLPGPWAACPPRVPPVPGPPPCPPGNCAEAVGEIIATATSNTVSADFVPFTMHLTFAVYCPCGAGRDGHFTSVTARRRGWRLVFFVTLCCLRRKPSGSPSFGVDRRPDERNIRPRPQGGTSGPIWVRIQSFCFSDSVKLFTEERSGQLECPYR